MGVWQQTALALSIGGIQFVAPGTRTLRRRLRGGIRQASAREAMRNRRYKTRSNSGSELMRGPGALG